MVAVQKGEVQPGLVVHLDTDKLRTLGNCKSNVKQDRTAEGSRYFLILASSQQRSTLRHRIC